MGEHTHKENREIEENDFTKRANKLQSEIDKINTKARLVEQQVSVHKADLVESTSNIVEVINNEIHEWQHIVESQKSIIQDKNDIIQEYEKQLEIKDGIIDSLRRKIDGLETIEGQFTEDEVIDEQAEED